jgi:hypothetical protein
LRSRGGSVGGLARGILAAGAVVIAGAAPGCARARSPDPFAWAPADPPAVARGRQVASRFELQSLWQVTVVVDDAFSAANRGALAAAERRLAVVPGVRRVIGPAALIGDTPDAAGAGQRVVRRADALGWFLAVNGRVVRFLIDTADFERARPGVEAALAGSGLTLSRPPPEGLEARPLLPDPGGRGARWLPAGLAVAWVLFMIAAGAGARPVAGQLSRPRAVAVALAAAAGVASIFLGVPARGVRVAGGLAAAAAAATVLAVALWESRRVPRRYDLDRPLRPPAGVLAAAFVIVAAGGLLAPRLRVATSLWGEAPVMFISVRGDLDEPVVLREVRRLTDFVRAQPGVESAWSVADLFMRAAAAPDEAARIPDAADQVRRVLVEARADPAVRLELSGDHHDGLVVVRFGADSAAGRLELVDRIGDYIKTELRAWLLHVDLGAPGLSPVTRSLGKGLLAGDARERVLRACARSGRRLGPADAAAVERAARRAALLPLADAPRLRAEIADDVRSFFARSSVPALRLGEQVRLVDGLAALPDGATPEEVRAVLGAAYGTRLAGVALDGAAAALARRLAGVRRRHTARINFKQMLDATGLPVEGVLADEVRSATLEAMGPVVGVPAPAAAAGAFRIEATPVGGAPNDGALSDEWEEALVPGVAVGATGIGVLLLLLGGLRGLGWLPVALAPLAAAAAPPAIAGAPLGLATLSFLAGALAGGAVVASSLAARRHT